jgi:hypothetical protein
MFGSLDLSSHTLLLSASLCIFRNVCHQQPHLSSEASQFEYGIQEGISVFKCSCFLNLIELNLDYPN